MESETVRHKINRLVIVCDGFAPTRKELKQATHLLQESRPDLSTGDYTVTLLEWPGGVPREYATASMATAIMKSEWGQTVLLKYFKVDIDSGAKIFFLEYANADAQRVAAIVATGGVPAHEEDDGEPDRFQPLTHWTRYPSLHPVSQVTLETLASPLFQRHAPTGAEPTTVRQEQIRRLVSPASRYNKTEDCQALERATRNLPADFPGFALGYLWRSVAFAGLGRFEEAFCLLETGLELCADPLQICAACAHLCERTGSLVQLGWHMQECFLCTDSYWAYLTLAQAALSSEMHELSRSLFAASDVVCRTDGMWRPSPEEATRIDGLVGKNLLAVRASLTRFADCIEPILTELRVVPDNPVLRAQWLQENKEPRKALAEYLISGRRNLT